MPDRSVIKSAHESFYVDAFIEWHSRAFRSRFRVIGRPDPPDAIIQSGRRTRWVEIGGVYWNKGWARDLNSHATPGEAHQAIEPGPYSGMDEQLAAQFCAVLTKKLENGSYEQSYAQYGAGYLVLAMMSPFAFDATTVQFMRRKWAATAAANKGFFRGIFLAYRSPNFGELCFQRWS